MSDPRSKIKQGGLSPSQEMQLHNAQRLNERKSELPQDPCLHVAVASNKMRGVWQEAHFSLPRRLLKIIVHTRLLPWFRGKRIQIGHAYTRRSPGIHRDHMYKLSWTKFFLYLATAPWTVDTNELSCLFLLWIASLKV